jgi:hypothetical protein
VRHRLVYAALAGSLDIGTRYAVFHWLTAGLYQSYGTVNTESWRRFAPTVVSALATSWLMGPLEIARKAFYADVSFPEHLQKGYKSVFHAFRSLAMKEPYALFKNSMPTVMASYVQTSFLFGIYDYTYDMTSILFRQGNVPIGIVKFA